MAGSDGQELSSRRREDLASSLGHSNCHSTQGPWCLEFQALGNGISGPSVSMPFLMGQGILATEIHDLGTWDPGIPCSVTLSLLPGSIFLRMV